MNSIFYGYDSKRRCLDIEIIKIKKARDKPEAFLRSGRDSNPRPHA